jgi:membrane protease YdiL (CAAX protease family)
LRPLELRRLRPGRCRQIGHLMKDYRVASWSALIFAMVFPTIVTLAYFVVLAGQPAWLQQTAYVVGKTIQFAFPAWWVFWVLRRRIRWSAPRVRGLVWGIGFGVLVLGLMLFLYYVQFKPAGLFEKPGEEVRKKVIGLGIDAVWKYALLGFFYALLHSFLEEYYWRWFVCGRLRWHVRRSAAIGVSSLTFMAHHVILLATFFGWLSPWTYLFSLGVAAGGAFWAWLYLRSRSLVGPWLSHLFVDAAIFLIGYDLVRDLL